MYAESNQAAYDSNIREVTGLEFSFISLEFGNCIENQQIK